MSKEEIRKELEKYLYILWRDCRHTFTIEEIEDMVESTLQNQNKRD